MEAPIRMKRKRPAEAEEEEEEEEEALMNEVEEMIAAGVLDPKKAGLTEKGVDNREGLIAALESFERVDLPWLERLDVTSAERLTVRDVNDDLARELQFYNQALAAVKAARAELDRLEVPHLRPDDFFAEMLKSDAHMQRVKEKLLSEQRRMESFEQRKRSQESRKFAKQVQTERLKLKAREKKETIENVSNWRKRQRGLEGGGGGSGELRDSEIDAMLKNTGSRGAAGGGGRGGGGGGGGAGGGAGGGWKGGKNPRRQAKDERYGRGGPKRGRKDNDSKSSRSMRDFSGPKNKALPAGMAAKKAFKNKGANRPGKSSRMRKRVGK